MKRLLRKFFNINLLLLLHLLNVTFLKIYFSEILNSIYGEDNRLSASEAIYRYPSLKLLLKSDVLLVEKNNLEMLSSGKFKILRNKFFNVDKKNRKICKNTKFYGEKLVGFCSGFLVSENLIVTAGHCVENQGDCKKTVFIFDYFSGNSNIIRKENVFFCKKLISQNFNDDDDHAIIQMDRKVEGRTPVKLYKKKLKKHSKIIMIGHPYGMPTKISISGKICKIQKKIFSNNLDCFRGNSGSMIIDEETLSVVGMMSRGLKDFSWNSSKKCLESIPNLYSEGMEIAVKNTIFNHFDIKSLHLVPNGIVYFPLIKNNKIYWNEIQIAVINYTNDIFEYFLTVMDHSVKIVESSNGFQVKKIIQRNEKHFYTIRINNNNKIPKKSIIELSTIDGLIIRSLELIFFETQTLKNNEININSKSSNKRALQVTKCKNEMKYLKNIIFTLLYNTNITIIVTSESFISISAQPVGIKSINYCCYGNKKIIIRKFYANRNQSYILSIQSESKSINVKIFKISKNNDLNEIKIAEEKQIKIEKYNKLFLMKRNSNYELFDIPELKNIQEKKDISCQRDFCYNMKIKIIIIFIELLFLLTI